MGGFSLWHWLVVGLVVLLLFGRGRFSEMMGDVAKGLKTFKKGMAEEDELHGPTPPRQIARDAQPASSDPVATREPGVTVSERPLSERDIDRRV